MILYYAQSYSLFPFCMELQEMLPSNNSGLVFTAIIFTLYFSSYIFQALYDSG